MTAARSQTAQLSGRAPRLEAGAAAVLAMRPHQWTKNLLLFAGLLFAGELGDPSRWLEAIVAFCSYCAVSSAAYLVNDVHDAHRDRLHPSKRFRAVASGKLPRKRALVLAGVLGSVGLTLAVSLGLFSLLIVLGFATIQVAYTFELKRLLIVDVLTIGVLFVLRASAGAVAVHVRISPWLLLCTLCLALFLGFAKRRGEFVLNDGPRSAGRVVLERYSLRLLDVLVCTTALATGLAYSRYTLTARHGGLIVATIPFVVLGLLRYLQLIYRDGEGEEPERVLLTDLPTLACVAAWALLAATSLAGS